MIDWDAAYDAYCQAGSTGSADVIRLLAKLGAQLPPDRPSKLKWFEGALRDEARRWFVADLFGHANQLPGALVTPMTQAGIDADDERLRGRFIALAAARDVDAACMAFCRVFVGGSRSQRLGAARALYYLPDHRCPMTTRKELLRSMLVAYDEEHDLAFRHCLARAIPKDLDGYPSVFRQRG